jgi:predicted restriction endonuclease
VAKLPISMLDLNRPRVVLSRILVQQRQRLQHKQAAQRYRDKQPMAQGYVRRKLLGRYVYTCTICGWRVLAQLGRPALAMHRATCPPPLADRA